MKYVSEVFKKYAVFSGRATRAEYWYFSLFVSLVILALTIIQKALGGSYSIINVSGDSFFILVNIFYFIEIIFDLIVLIPGFTVGIRRLHDVGKSGWWTLLVLLPIIGWIWLLILAVTDSAPGTNKYGPNPKGILDNKIGNI
jgi:uncharacterized membrane protein YhaH (DUF805 family)